MTVDGVTSFSRERSSANVNTAKYGMIPANDRQDNLKQDRKMRNASRLEYSSFGGLFCILLREPNRRDCMYHAGPIRDRTNRALAVLAKTATCFAWPSALWPSVVSAPRRYAHGLLCSGFVYLSWTHSRHQAQI